MRAMTLVTGLPLLLMSACGGGSTGESPAGMSELDANPRNNLPPVAFDGAVEVQEDGTVEVALAGGDLDSDTVAFFVVDEPEHGSLTGQPPELTYTPHPDFHGHDAMSFAATDGQFESALAWVDLTVHSVNDVPVLADYDLVVQLDGGTSLEINLEAVDVDADTVSWAYDLVLPEHGTLTGALPNVTYTPEDGFDGTDRFTYRATDGADWSAPGAVELVVLPVEDPWHPTDKPNEYTAGNTALLIDVDAQAMVAAGWAVEDVPQDTERGGAVIDQGDYLEYRPPAGDELVQDSFVYTVEHVVHGSRSVAVTIEVGSRIWYVSNGGVNGASGTSWEPRATLRNMVEVLGPDETVYVTSGDYVVGNLSAMPNRTTIVGAGTALEVDGRLLYDAGSAPTLSSSRTTVVQLSPGSSLGGVFIEASGVRDGVSFGDGVTPSLLWDVTIVNALAGVDIKDESDVTLQNVRVFTGDTGLEAARSSVDIVDCMFDSLDIGIVAASSDL